jgi:DDE superfamily endonuclease/Helix-turn-helix of DDE superfamily endonuclease
MTGLSAEQFDTLLEMVAQALEKPWQAPVGRPRELDLREAVFVTLVYARHNVTEELLAAFMGVDQSQISRMINALTPVIETVTAPRVPTEQDATEALTGQVALVDGSLAPCWSWAGRRDLWAGKHATTGHNFLVIADLLGRIWYVSDPHPGKDHDMTLVKDEPVARILAVAADVIADKGFQGSGYSTPVKKPQGGYLTWLQTDFNNQLSGLRAAIERAVAHIKNWRILHTDYRRPINTWETSFRAAIGLFFFSITQGFA